MEGASVSFGARKALLHNGRIECELRGVEKKKLLHNGRIPSHELS